MKKRIIFAEVHDNSHFPHSQTNFHPRDIKPLRGLPVGKHPGHRPHHRILDCVSGISVCTVKLLRVRHSAGIRFGSGYLGWNLRYILFLLDRDCIIFLAMVDSAANEEGIGSVCNSIVLRSCFPLSIHLGFSGIGLSKAN